MSESGDYDPGPWSGHSFSAAYDHYDAHVGRSYDDAVAKSKPRAEVLEKSIKTNCHNPLIIMADVTGSMGQWPATMFSKLPYLEHEAKVYLGKDTEIAFGAIGDAHGSPPDQYPLQMRPFAKGKALEDRMLELVIEGGGGGQLSETYELGALYCLHNVKMPNAIKPVLIMIGDEKPYGVISADMAKSVAGVNLEKQVYTKDVFKKLKDKFSVYLIRKPYHEDGGNKMSAEDREIRERWVELLGSDHICDLPAPERVVDVIFGILAEVAGRYDEFMEEIEGRQKPDQVEVAYKSLATIHKLPGKSAKGGRAGQSILKLGHQDVGKPTKRLI